MPQRAHTHRGSFALRRALRLCHIARLLAAATREDILAWLRETMAKSPDEAERRLRA